MMYYPRNHKSYLYLIVFLATILSASSAHAQVFVDSLATGANDGSSWTNAYTNLKTAIDSTVSGEIWVAKGTYYPSTDPLNRDSSFQLKNNVAIYGGFAGGETLLLERDFIINATYLSGALSDSYHVVNNTSGQDSTAILDGVFIVGGLGDNGAAMQNVSSSPLIRHCTFQNNEVTGSGSNVYNINASPQIIACTFINNIGRAMLNENMSNARIDKCIFINNQDIFWTGVEMVNYSSSPTITNCVFSNTAENNPEVFNGLGAFPTFINCTFYGASNGATPIMFNQDDAFAIIINCIMVGTTNPIEETNPGSSFVYNSLIEGGYSGCTTCTSTMDPVFVNTGDPVGADNMFRTSDDGFNLVFNSATVNTGLSENNVPTTDILGEMRVCSTDIGAYEYRDTADILVYVDSSAVGNNDGTSWSDAFTDLKSATNCMSSGEIWVAKGTYYPTTDPLDREASFYLRNNIAIYGGFSGDETLLSERDFNTNHTYLSGALSDSYHVVKNTTGQDSTAVLDGFHIVDGLANHPSDGFDKQGAGMVNQLSSPIIRNCTFRNNEVTSSGSGMYNLEATPYVYNCNFVDNIGGAMVNRQSSPRIDACVFLDNATNGVLGSEMFNFESSPSVTNSIFSNNSSNPEVFNWPVASPSFVNCTFYGNSEASTPSIMNSASAYAIVQNCIFSGSEVSISDAGVVTSVVSHSLINPTDVCCTTCTFSNDSIFVNTNDPLGPDGVFRTSDDGFRLVCNPATIGTGSSEGAPLEDISGTMRGADTHLGAYEYEGPCQIINSAHVLKFDGEDDYVHLSTSSALPFLYTIETWVRFDSDPAGQSVLVMTDGADPDEECGVQLKVDDDGFFNHVVYLNGYEGPEFADEYIAMKSPIEVEAHRWYRVSIHAGGVQSGVVAISVDGNRTEVQYNQPNGFITNPITEIYLGKPACSAAAFDGEMDELRVWSKDTSTTFEEVVCYDPSLVHLFNFNQGIGGGDNNNPQEDVLVDPYNNETGTLHNFTLDGMESNWMSCGLYDVQGTYIELDTFVLVEQIIGTEVVLTSPLPGADSTSVYQWYKDGLPISGDATSDPEIPTLIIPNIQPSDAGRYYFSQTTSGGCTVFSDSRDLIVRGTGEVLNFDGENDHVIFKTIYDFNNEYTIELWLKFDEQVELQNIITGTDARGPNAFVTNQLYTDASGRLVHYVVSNNLQQYEVVYDTPFEPDVWYHIAARTDSSEGGMSLTVNGVLDTMSQIAGPTLLNQQLNTYYIGSEATNPDTSEQVSLSPFSGEMEELRIWVTSKSDSLIASLMDSEILSDTFFVYDLKHYFRFNKGLADGNNTSPPLDIMPDFAIPEYPQLEPTARLKNFSLTGPASNWSDCSPITNAVLEYSLAYQPQIGQGIETEVFVSRGDSSVLDFQWLFNGEPIIGQNNALFSKENITIEDTGRYEVIVSDFCDPPFVDTLLVGHIDPTCYKDLPHQVIDYISQTRYYACLNPQGESGVCDSLQMLGVISNALSGNYCGEDQKYTGQENIFKLGTLAESKVIDLTLSNITAGVDVFVFNDSCDVSSCLASATTDSVVEHILVTVPAGDNYIIIDSREAITSGADSIILDVIVYDSKCDSSIAIACGDHISGNTAEGQNFLTDYCDVQGYSGKELVYEIILDSAQTLFITMSNMSVDLDMFLMDSSCTESICLKSATQDGIDLGETMTFGAQAGTYYLVIDGKNGATGTFDLSLECENYFTASVNESDAHIDLSWAIDKNLCVPQDTGVLIRLITTPGTILFEEEFTTAALTPDVITGNFRHIVGDSVSRAYVLRVYNRLSNTTICEEYQVGKTIAFQQPELISVSNPDFVDSIHLVWRNHSDLSDAFNIFRDGVLIASFNDGYTEDSLIVTFQDGHDLNDTSSIDQASSYQYCIETYNNTLNQGYTQLCAEGSTYSLGFEATDGTPSDMISLTWNDLTEFCDAIKISRNGIQLRILSASETYYNDLSPIFGAVSSYSLTILRDGAEVMTVSDEGSVGPNGSISGRLKTGNGGYPVQNALVMLYKDSLIQGAETQVLVQTVPTDFNGEFVFDGLYYGLADQFTIRPEKPNSEFDPVDRSIELNGAIPQVDGVVFEDTAQVVTQINAQLLDTFTLTRMVDEDYIAFNWSYPGTSDTSYFTLKRNGVLIFEGNNSVADVDSFSDLTGVPGYDYTYTLEAFQYDNGLVKTAVRTLDAQYPALTPLSGFDVVRAGEEHVVDSVQSYDPRIIFEWSGHPSINFDGYRLYRDNILVGQVAFDGQDSIGYLSPPGVQAGYSIRTFKKIDGVTFESAQYPLVDTLVLSNALWAPELSTTTGSGRSIVIDVSNFDPLFYSEAIYAGIMVERKAMTDGDSAYVNIGTLTRTNVGALALAGIEPVIWDTYGVPGASYTYRISTYIQDDEDTYLQSTEFDRTCPAVEGPASIQAVEDTGSVVLNWTDNSLITTAQGQRYINYTGLELTRRDFANNAPPQLVGVLPATQSSFSDYVSNPVFDIFFNDYVSTDYEYVLKGYLDIEGIRYYSDSLAVIAGPLDGSTEQPLPTEFVGSHDIPGHIKLCWEWEAVQQSKFVIYRGLLAIDTMPPSARAYYDYDAPSGPSVPYRIASLHSGNLSEFVLTNGSMPSRAYVVGRVSNYYTSAAIANANVYYENMADIALGVNAGLYSGFTTTDSTGNYYLENIPAIAGLEFIISVNGNNIDFDSTSVYQETTSDTIMLDSSMIATGTDHVVDFLEFSREDSEPGVSPITAVSVTADPAKMHVVVKWSPENDNYDGFEIFRANVLIGEVQRGEGFTLIDSTGFAGIDYTWLVRSYKNEISGRVYSDWNGRAGTFPNIAPVENMTVTAFSEMNLMRVSWSHPYDAHDSYLLRRNGEVMASVPTGSVLMWYDSTGIPGREYQYELTAVKGDHSSVPVVVVQRYKGVGEVDSLEVHLDETVVACEGVTTNTNRVYLSWQYEAEAADGFEVYRDDQLIAEIAGNQLAFGNAPLQQGQVMGTGPYFRYEDFEGSPGENHVYHVLAFVIREGLRYVSGIEELLPTQSISYPEIAQIQQLKVSQNNLFGSVEIVFVDTPHIVAGYEILREGEVIDTVFGNSDGVHEYQDFAGVPGTNYSYAVRAYDRRDGVTFYSSAHCTGEVVFPMLPVPQGLTASQGTYQSHIEVRWEYPLMASLDTFYLEAFTSEDTMTAAFAAGSRKYIDVVEDLEFELFSYRIRASKLVAGEQIYSSWSAPVDGWSQSQVDGSEDQEVDPDFGFGALGSVTIDGDWAIKLKWNILIYRVVIDVYRRENGGWSVFQSIVAPAGSGYFGKTVSLSGNRFILRGDNDALIYTFNGADWGYPKIISRDDGVSFGYDMDLDGDQLIISDPLRDDGYVYIYNFIDGQWIESFSKTVAGLFCGVEVTIDGNLAATTFRDSADTLMHVHIFKKQNGVWGDVSEDMDESVPAELIIPAYQNNWSQRLDIDDNILVVGDVDAQRVLVAELEDGILTSPPVEISDPVSSIDSTLFGNNVSVMNIPSPIDDAVYLVIGSPLSYGSVGQMRKAYIYSNVNGPFEIIGEYESEVQEQEDIIDHSVEISEDAFILEGFGASSFEQGHAQIVNLLDAPINVQATKGLSIDNDPSETTVSWDFKGNQDLLAGFKIYRDDEFLIYRDKGTAIPTAPNTISDTWNDNSGNPGQRYVYSVRSVNNNIPFESYGGAAEGYSEADGILRGSVTTQFGTVPVPGVLITAIGVVDQELYTYTTTTLANGEYIFNSAFYDSDPDRVTQYVISAEYLDHTIIPSSTATTILNSDSDPVQGIVNFFDITAYIIKGTVSQPGVTCPIEGLKVTAIKNGIPQIGQEEITDADGNYALVINPYEDNLEEIRIRIDQSITNDGDTLRYNFTPDADTVFNDFINFPLVTEVNYSDELTYDISLSVKNTCNDAISTALWDIRVRTLDGCFDEVYQTNSNGDLNVALLPLNYTMSVVGVSDPTFVNQQALDYFSNFPVTLNLLDIHRDSFTTLSHESIAQMSARRFTFHKAPQIEVIGLDDFICGTQTAVLEQGFTYTLQFDISEMYQGENCPVDEGIIEISNPASTENGSVIIPYNSATETFDEYTFIAGGPSQIFPHAYAVTFDYKTTDGTFLGRLTRVVFVAGTVSVPGTDIIVDAAAGNDAVPYPLMVLRDPPGDQSQSFIAANQTISFEDEMSIDIEAGGSLYKEFGTTIAGNDTKFTLNAFFDYTFNKTVLTQNTVTTSSEISTSGGLDDLEAGIGRDADIMVGTGLVMQVGLIHEYSVEDCGKIKVTETKGISPNSVSTTWAYQISQIEDIIQGYRNDSIKLEENNFDITLGSDTLSKEEARIFLRTMIRNWEEVLVYHDVKTLPHYVLCTFEPEPSTGIPILDELFNASGAIDTLVQRIEWWQSKLIPLFGAMIDGEFVLNDDIIWTQELIDAYNAGYAAIRELMQGNLDEVWVLPDDTQNLNDANLSAILSAPDVIEHNAMFGEPVKNITIGGNITLDESINSAGAITTTYSNEYYFGTKLDASIGFQVDNEIEVGTFAGLGGGVTFSQVVKVAAASFETGGSVKLNHKRKSSMIETIEESVEIGYFILDDESSDAFSFAVIQPIAPNMTPYFDYFGGRSSCPPEPGSVFIDDPQIAILDLQVGGTSQSKELFYVPANEAATFQLIIANQTPISSLPTRELEVSMEPSSNGNGALVMLNGIDLGVGTYIDSLDAWSPDTLLLTIERGPSSYDYEDIQIDIEPSCGKGPKRSVFVSAHFINPCSPVSLVAPDENWVLNDDTTKLVVAMQDYDPENPFFVDATLQYRRVGAGQAWDDVNPLELERGNYVDGDALQLNDSEYAAGQIPKYFFVWNVPTTEGAYPDGEYELRVKMMCDNFSSTISNVIGGRIARDGLNLFGSPQPADQIWTAGDEISFTFNKDLDCALLTPLFVDDHISLWHVSADTAVGFTMNCYANKLIFELDEPMSTYDGQFLTVSVDDITSLEGNVSQLHNWTFRVITQTIYWTEADTVKLRMYELDTSQLSLFINNDINSPVPGLSLVAADGSFGDWLTLIDPVSPSFSVNPSGKTVTFDIVAPDSVGFYNETVNVLGAEGTGNTPQVHIQLEVLEAPPIWNVDPGAFTSSMEIIANWKFNSPFANASIDEADLISVWVGDELRGVASISKTGNYYASYLTVYGRIEDGDSTLLEFRVWDADPGIEYEGYPTESVLYLANTTRGTTVNPEILVVNEDCPNVLVIGHDGAPFAQDRTFEAKREIIILGDWTVPPAVDILFNTPTLTLFENELNIATGATVTVRREGCQ